MCQTRSPHYLRQVCRLLRHLRRPAHRRRRGEAHDTVVAIRHRALGLYCVGRMALTGQFANRPESNQHGRLGNIEGRPNAHDLIVVITATVGATPSGCPLPLPLILLADPHNKMMARLQNQDRHRGLPLRPHRSYIFLLFQIVIIFRIF